MEMTKCMGIHLENFNRDFFYYYLKKALKNNSRVCKYMCIY